jgi:hypothetical protein
MPLYNCEFCNYTTKYKADFTKHTKTKKHRVNSGDEIADLEGTTPNIQYDPQNIQYNPQNIQYIPQNIQYIPQNIQYIPQNIQSNPQNIQSYACDYCNIEFTLFTNKRRHELHRCKKNEHLKDLKIRTLEKEKKKLEKKIEKLLNKEGTINNTTNNNTNNNTNNIIVVNNYGKENTDYLTVDKIRKLLDRPYESVQELIKMLHFNSEHPENHNVKITNKKEPYALVWNDPIWELRKKKSVVKDIVDKGYMMIDTTYDNMEESNKKYINFQTKFDDDATHTKDTIEEDTEMVIINETKKLQSTNYETLK